MEGQENHRDKAPAIWQNRLGAKKHRLVTVVPITIATWLGVIFIYGYFWVNHVLETEILYGYERSPLLISTAFIFDKGPYLLIALVVVIVLELLFALYLEHKF